MYQKPPYQFGFVKLSWFSKSLISLNTFCMLLCCVCERECACEKETQNHWIHCCIWYVVAFSIFMPTNTCCNSVLRVCKIRVFDRRRTMLIERCARGMSVWVCECVCTTDIARVTQTHPYRCNGVSRLLPPHCKRTAEPNDVVGGLDTYVNVIKRKEEKKRASNIVPSWISGMRSCVRVRLSTAKHKLLTVLSRT